MKEVLGNTASKSTAVSKLVKDNVIYTEPCEIVNVFNNYFCSLPGIMENALVQGGDVLVTPRLLDLNLLSSRDSDSFITKKLSPTHLKPYLNSLKTKYFSVADAVPSAIYVRCSDVLLSPLTQLINLSFSQHIFPNSLKTAQTTPIYKNGSRTDPMNYRPISQLPEPGNIIEKIVKDRLYSFLEGTQYFTPAQYGFRSKLSTSCAVFDFVSIVYRVRLI